MKKKRILALVLAFVMCGALFCLCACQDPDADTNLNEFSGITFESKTVTYDGAEHTITVSGAPAFATVMYAGNKGTQVGVYNAKAIVTANGYKALTLTATLTITQSGGSQTTPTTPTAPTANTFVTAAQKAASDNLQSYDFTFNIKAKTEVAGYTGAANGNYDAQYRYNKSTSALQFKRTTSGLLFYDSTKYIFTQGNQKITMGQKEDGTINNIAVAASQDEELLLINLPFVSLINSLNANSLDAVKSSAESGYAYQVNLKLSSSNDLLDAILKVIERLGMSITIKNVTFTNPTNGITIYFNLDSAGKLKDYKLGAEIQFEAASRPVTCDINYEQKQNTTAVSVPSTAGVIFDNASITTELNTIKNAISAVQNKTTYSLDLLAYNEFDPGWNKLATKDRFTSRMYKNTYTLDGNPFTAFNNSYEYKTHHEADGAETYKYTIGNIQNGTVYSVSRKGSNVVESSNKTLQTQFNYMTSEFNYTANNVDCIKKVTASGKTTFYVYLNKASTLTVKDKICAYINSNTETGVVKVDNYFNNSDCSIESADMIVEMTGSSLTKIAIETNIRYNPTAGDYTDKVIKLTDRLELEVNAQLSKAQDYTAPKSTSTGLGGFGLNNFNYYIL